MANEFLAEPPLPPRLFSVRAISVGAFVGGPLAAACFIGVNFGRLGHRRAARMAFAVGLISTVLLLWGITSVPSEIGDRLPRQLIPAIYTALAAYLAQRLQGDEIKRAIEQGARKVSGWVIAGWSVLSLVVTIGGVIPFALAVPPFGFHGEKQIFGPKGAYEVYYDGGVTQTETKALADYLMGCEYFSGEERHAVQVVKNGSGYTLSLAIDRQHWDKPELLASLKNAGAEIQQSALRGNLKLILVDEDFAKTYRKEL
jgi:hypothetical protein